MIINHRWNLYSHLLGLITGTLYILVDCYAIICFILETRSQVMHLDKIIIFFVSGCFWCFWCFLTLHVKTSICGITSTSCVCVLFHDAGDICVHSLGRFKNVFDIQQITLIDPE